MLVQLENPIIFVTTTVSILIFILAVALFLINTRRGNLLIAFMYMEVLLLAGNMLFIVASLHLGDIAGQLFSLGILTVAAAESAIGLALVIALFKLTGAINFEQLATPIRG